MSRVGVIVPAAGAGRRMGGVAKPFLSLAGQPVLARAIAPFLAEPRVVRVVVALSADHAADPPDWLARRDDRVRIVEGGAERADSVRAALVALPADAEIVVIHDAARPLVEARLIASAIDAAEAGRSVTVGVPLADTVHAVNAEGRITATPDRRGIWRAQTPQAFPRTVLETALRCAERDGIVGTDEAGLVARYAGPVWMMPGDPANLKITEPIDLVLAAALVGRGAG